MKYTLLLLTSLVIILSGCTGAVTGSSEAAKVHILSVPDNTIEFDTLRRMEVILLLSLRSPESCHPGRARRAFYGV